MVVLSDQVVFLYVCDTTAGFCTGEEFDRVYSKLRNTSYVYIGNFFGK